MSDSQNPRNATAKAIPSPLVADRATWEILKDRIHAQQHRVYNALGVVHMAATQIFGMYGDDNSNEITPLLSALSLVEETLADIAERLEAPVILNGWPASPKEAPTPA
jgi:hypothetical protein